MQRKARVALIRGEDWRRCRHSASSGLFSHLQVPAASALLSPGDPGSLWTPNPHDGMSQEPLPRVRAANPKNENDNDVVGVEAAAATHHAVTLVCYIRPPEWWSRTDLRTGPKERTGPYAPHPPPPPQPSCPPLFLSLSSHSGTTLPPEVASLTFLLHIAHALMRRGARWEARSGFNRAPSRFSREIWFNRGREALKNTHF